MLSTPTAKIKNGSTSKINNDAGKLYNANNPIELKKEIKNKKINN